MRARHVVAPDIGRAPACPARRINRAGRYRQDARRRGRLSSPRHPPSRPRAPLAFSESERQARREGLDRDRVADCAPRTVDAPRRDAGRSVGSVRTMYRLLAAAAQARARRHPRVHPADVKPELLAVPPNEVWSWEITKRNGPVKWTGDHRYGILDLFSRYVVDGMIALRESAQLPEHLIAETVAKHHRVPGTLTLHADRGSSMRSKPGAAVLLDLAVAKPHSRPHVSDDKPYSEAPFKPLTYRPDCPERFGSLDDARAHCPRFFHWDNTLHGHSGIGLMTPERGPDGRAHPLFAQRTATLTVTFLANPTRFTGRGPHPPRLPTAAWINPPKQKTTTTTPHPSTVISCNLVSQSH